MHKYVFVKIYKYINKQNQINLQLKYTILYKVQPISLNPQTIHLQNQQICNNIKTFGIHQQTIFKILITFTSLSHTKLYYSTNTILNPQTICLHSSSY